MWVAIFADVGVMIIAVLNAIRTLFVKIYKKRQISRNLSGKVTGRKWKYAKKNHVRVHEIHEDLLKIVE